LRSNGHPALAENRPLASFAAAALRLAFKLNQIGGDRFSLDVQNKYSKKQVVGGARCLSLQSTISTVIWYPTY